LWARGWLVAGTPLLTGQPVFNFIAKLKLWARPGWAAEGDPLQPRKKIEWASGGVCWAEVSALQFSYKIERLLAIKEGCPETEQLAN